MTILRATLPLQSLLAALIWCGSVMASQSEAPSNMNDKHYERAVLEQILPVLRASNKAGRIYYEASCVAGESGYPIAFPEVNVTSLATVPKGINDLQKIFRDAKHVVIDEVVGDTVRIKFGTVADGVLRTQIPTLKLNRFEQYNPFLAIYAIINSPEVQSAMRDLHIVVPNRATSMFVVRPAEGLSHLPSELSNLTMDDALDMIARTWSGVVLYGSCTGSGMYEVSFADSSHVVGSS